MTVPVLRVRMTAFFFWITTPRWPGENGGPLPLFPPPIPWGGGHPIFYPSPPLGGGPRRGVWPPFFCPPFWGLRCAGSAGGPQYFVILGVLSQKKHPPLPPNKP